MLETYSWYSKKHVIHSLKSKKTIILGKICTAFHLDNFFLGYTCSEGFLFQLLLFTKWLLYRQRIALCCEMLLRHNWVRLDHSRGTERERERARKRERVKDREFLSLLGLCRLFS